MTNAYPIRKTPRAQWFEYNEALYFVTICTHGMRHYFGEIYDDIMHLTPLGQYLFEELSSPSLHHPHIEIPLFAVMPNHLHALVRVGTRRTVSAEDVTPQPLADVARRVPTERNARSVGRLPHTLLGNYVASLKSSVTRYARKNNISFKWQGRYHDHIIRNNDDMNNIGQYIENNVSRWKTDCFYT